MGAYVDYAQYGNMLSVPISQAQVEIRPNSTLLVGAVCLKLGQVLRLRFMSFSVVNMFAGTPSVTKIISGMPGCYVGLFAGEVDSTRRPGGLPITYLGLESVGYSQTNTAAYWDLSQPDIYGIILVNNTNERTFEAVVTGSARVEQTYGYYGLFDPDPGANRVVTAGIDYNPSDLTNPLNPLNPTGLTDPVSPNYDPTIVVIGSGGLPGTYIPPANC